MKSVVVGAAGVLGVLAAATALAAWRFNAEPLVAVDFGPAKAPELPAGTVVLIAVAVGALAGALATAGIAFRSVFAARLRQTEIDALRREVHAFRTLPLEGPSYLTADARGAAARAKPTVPPPQHEVGA